MEIKLRDPGVTIAVIIGILVILVIRLCFRIFAGRRKMTQNQKKNAVGYGAMWMVEAMPQYRHRKVLYTVLRVTGTVALVICLISSAVLMGRPSYTEKVTNGVQRRDIFLCLDVSYSLYGLNDNFVSNLENVVRGLNGDRIGISIYNTTTVLYMPMTDDQEFAISKLEELRHYFKMQQELLENFGDDADTTEMTREQEAQYEKLLAQLETFEAGTLVHNMTRGSSLIGDGLAACLYHFPSLHDAKRTRIVLLVTDNAENAFDDPVVELQEAAALCRKNDVKVFGIFPPKELFDSTGDGLSYQPLMNQMKTAVEQTGGAFYVASADLDTSGIVRQIQSSPAMQVDEITMTKTTDMPQTPLLLCLLSFCVFALIKAGGL